MLPIDQSMKLTSSDFDKSIETNGEDKLIDDPGSYQRLIGKLSVSL